jgi:hypothetical protein
MLPAILRTPIEYSVLTGDSAEKTSSRQIQQRLSAVYAYYGVKEKDKGAAKTLLILMAADLFPGAFKRVPKGTPRTKKPKWDCFSKTHLIEFIESRQAKGMTQEEAARLYLKRYCPERSSAKGLIAEYHRAERWSRVGKLTELEQLEVNELLRRDRLRYSSKRA